MGGSDWISFYLQKPQHGQWVLICNDPYWRFNPPVQMAKFVQPSALMGTSIGDDLRARFPEEFSDEALDEVDGAIIAIDEKSVLVHTHPWFPEFWAPLPRTPWDTGLAKPFNPDDAK